jgi:hypothetical protein
MCQDTQSLRNMEHSCEVGTMTEDGHYQLCVADLQSCEHTLVMTCGTTRKEEAWVSPTISDCLG